VVTFPRRQIFPKFTAKPREQDEVLFAFFRLRTWEVEFTPHRQAGRGEERAKHPVLRVGTVEEAANVMSSPRDCHTLGRERSNQRASHASDADKTRVHILPRNAARSGGAPTSCAFSSSKWRVSAFRFCGTGKEMLSESNSFKKPQETIVIECHSVPGFSGSPVIAFLPSGALREAALENAGIGP
jgi:hypothetical protein